MHMCRIKPIGQFDDELKIGNELVYRHFETDRPTSSKTIYPFFFEEVHNKDTPARIMHVRLPDSNSNSPMECAARCHGYAYSGTQVAIECYCGDYLNAVKRPDSECNRACRGDSSKKCGADWRMSVYSIRGKDFDSQVIKDCFNLCCEDPDLNFSPRPPARPLARPPALPPARPPSRPPARQTDRLKDRLTD
ncbi:hypothetical protein DPMN_134426 [Dreissena polymorpha]|uniref:WSC domain-containing protein n=1 Tax=Dreissena polymorpha TaxID=45954 RepID=A0A9D4FX70_DREPO|nr:hypothetical protein DPMN_134426 [Dreissena polymorpha]